MAARRAAAGHLFPFLFCFYPKADIPLFVFSGVDLATGCSSFLPRLVVLRSGPSGLDLVLPRSFGCYHGRIHAGTARFMAQLCQVLRAPVAVAQGAAGDFGPRQYGAAGGSGRGVPCGSSGDGSSSPSAGFGTPAAAAAAAHADPASGSGVQHRHWGWRQALALGMAANVGFDDGGWL